MIPTPGQANVEGGRIIRLCLLSFYVGFPWELSSFSWTWCCHSLMPITLVDNCSTYSRGWVSSWRNSRAEGTNMKLMLASMSSSCLQMELRSCCLEWNPTSWPGERCLAATARWSATMRHIPSPWFFCARARCLSAGLRYLRLTRLPRHDRGPVPGGNRSAATCLCTVLRRALYHYATRTPAIFLVHEKVTQGASKSADYRAYQRIAPKSLELVVVSQPVALAFCGRLLTASQHATYFDPGTDSKPIELNATFPIVLEQLAFLGDTRSRRAGLCTSESITTPADHGNPGDLVA